MDNRFSQQKEGDNSFLFTVKSIPPPGYYRVTELYVDPITGKLIVEYSDELTE